LLPFDPNALAKAAWCWYSVHMIDKDLPLLIQAIVDAITHDGFSHIDVDQACPSWRKR
jgi:pyruvate/2-oxoacid:ferredoxin oxidoreductase beta subunit